MNKFLLLCALLVGSSAMAHDGGRYGGPDHWRRHHHHHHNWQWTVPALVTGAIVYRAMEPAPQVYVQPSYPGYGLPPTPNCGPWIESFNADGSLTRSRTCY